MNKKILDLALPNIVSNITIPLLGMVDLAIMGHLESEIYIGDVKVICGRHFHIKESYSKIRIYRILFECACQVFFKNFINATLSVKLDDNRVV